MRLFGSVLIVSYAFNETGGTTAADTVTLNGTTGILYADGLEAARNSAMSQTPASLGSSPLIYIGTSQWNDPYLSGQIDDFASTTGH
ncbi:hypothetical protein GCM10010912_29410 [Paenibacillus albidus]|uniref:Uncharacterized protein n=1 Tax=Paenibacillus albidus TaxID=2041023 RepID=A0A917FG83_9BACL|nr:LamG domain-containing protein [Paenibacillus albidus]GGF82404.1 hypothetical protein GCM10010912_29410 [Paenibacillus albidus]